MIDTLQIAKKLLEQKNLHNDPAYNWKEIFEIRDACLTLAKFGLEDKSLLDEILRYIGEKVGE